MQKEIYIIFSNSPRPFKTPYLKKEYYLHNAIYHNLKGLLWVKKFVLIVESHPRHM